MRHATPPRGQQDGYILLTVLAILIVLVMLATAAATTASRVREDQQRDDARLAGELAARSTRATLLYMLATQRMTFAGLTVDDRVVYTPSQLYAKEHGDPDVLSLTPVGNELRMDGTVYAGLGGSRFALRTDNAMFNLNWETAMRAKWLTQLGATPDQWPTLVDTLLDYQDPDDNRRLNGAEAPQYAQQGQPPPPNRTLFTALELRRIPGWEDLLSKVDDATLLHTVNAMADGPIDVNAASVEVLTLLPGVTRQQAERIVAMRDVQPFTQDYDVYSIAPTLRNPDPLITLYPMQSGTLTIWSDATNDGTLTHFTLTPFDDGGSPWHIDYAIRLPARRDGGITPVGQPQTPLLVDAQAAHP